MATRDTAEIIDWLVDGARASPELEDALAELCNRLFAGGIPLWRVGLFLLTLHPQIMGQRFLWMPDAGISLESAPFEAFETENFRNSPVRRVIDSGIAIRRRLADENCPIDFAMTRELKTKGATDYLVIPLFFTDGTVHGASFTSREPGGFSEAQIATLQSVIAPLARVAEIHSLRRTAHILLDTYVGNHAGSRILAGQIRRGDTTRINAAIWLSDMRGFTRFADRVAPQTLVDSLNAFFDLQVPAIMRHGGEVLKFIGDGLLAIFPIAADGKNTREVCAAALAAAREAGLAIGASFDTGGDGVRFGLALHLGEVLYGNIGSGNRLDFTCIGPAVNLAARIEKLAGELGQPILASDEYARHLPSEFTPGGQFSLRGFESARTVFKLKAVLS